MVCREWVSSDGLDRFRSTSPKVWLQESGPAGDRHHCFYFQECARNDNKMFVALYDTSRSLFFLLTADSCLKGSADTFKSQPTGGGEWQVFLNAGSNGWVDSSAPDSATTAWPEIGVPEEPALVQELPVALNSSAVAAKIRVVLQQQGFSMSYHAFDKNPVDAIVKHLEQTGEAFVDPWFDCPDKDQKTGLDLAWVRPVQLNSDIRMFQDGPCVTKVLEGAVSNCGASTCAVALQALNSQTFRDAIYPSEISRHGVYSVKIMQNGKEKYVLMDDLIPVLVGQETKPWSWSTSNNEEAWPMLFEKYLAKLRGGKYGAWGRGPKQTGQNLAGDVSELACGQLFEISSKTDITDDDHWQEMCDHLGLDAVACVASHEQAKAFDEHGIVGSHGYAIVGAAVVGDFRFLRLRSASGDVTWSGDWSDTSDLWQKHPDVKAVLGKSDTPDGTFWMERQDAIQFLWLRGRFNMQYVASASAGYTNSWATGILVPEMDVQAGACPALEFDLAEDGMLFWHAECFDARYSEDYLRLHTSVWKLNADSDPTLVLQTKNMAFGTWSVEPHHRIKCAAGKYAISVHPATTLLASTAFYLHVASQPVHTTCDGGKLVPLGTATNRSKVGELPNEMIASLIKKQLKELAVDDSGKIDGQDLVRVFAILGFSEQEANLATKDPDKMVDVDGFVSWLFEGVQ